MALFARIVARFEKKSSAAYPKAFDMRGTPIKDGPISRRKDHAVLNDEAISRLRAGATRLRRGVLWLIFGLILLIPKVNRLRRRRELWKLLRLFMACAGAVIVALGTTQWHSLALLAVGALMLLFALIVAPERPELSIDARARELGALIVVDGGRYIGASGRPHRVKLFLAPDRLLVLDSALQILFEIPLQQIRSLSVLPTGANWSLRVASAETTAEFLYEGIFGEHLARVAEATLRGQLHRELPVLH